MNSDIKLLAYGRGVPLYKIADALGLSESTFGRLLRKPLPDGWREKIEHAIDELAQKGVQDNA